MNKILAIAVVILITGAGCAVSGPKEAMTDEMKQSCRDSGGAAENDACTCPDGYELDTEGQCVDAFGLQGGELGEKVKKQHSRVLACNESAGSYDLAADACICPADDVLDGETGECLTAFGSADGIRGERVKAAAARVFACNESGGTYRVEESRCECPPGRQESIETGECSSGR